ncbi:K02A2.6-like [Cordylochernes scorpioides]|uniref:K02A2.6-like n=1 Tax=Cordylochernes scorpioides TaxID=51811 RepID=A0ABY6LF93_9ARAC|nr:K02A2.6-like [Cordylochernes scorpioides]
MREITARKTIEQLRRLFSAYGLPEEVVSDNGPQFTGVEMKSFFESSVVRQTLIPAYHPQSNGLAERAVQLIKMALEKNKRKFEDTIQDTLSRILLTYRCTPHETTGKTPSELFMGRSLRTRLTLIHQSLDNRVKTYQRDQIRRRWTSGEDGDEAREKREEEDDPIWMAPETIFSSKSILFLHGKGRCHSPVSQPYFRVPCTRLPERLGAHDFVLQGSPFTCTASSARHVEEELDFWEVEDIVTAVIEMHVDI